MRASEKDLPVFVRFYIWLAVKQCAPKVRAH